MPFIDTETVTQLSSSPGSPVRLSGGAPPPAVGDSPTVGTRASPAIGASPGVPRLQLEESPLKAATSRQIAKSAKRKSSASEDMVTKRSRCDSATGGKKSPQDTESPQSRPKVTPGKKSLGDKKKPRTPKTPKSATPKSKNKISNQPETGTVNSSPRKRCLKIMDFISSEDSVLEATTPGVKSRKSIAKGRRSHAFTAADEKSDECLPELSSSNSDAVVKKPVKGRRSVVIQAVVASNVDSLSEESDSAVGDPVKSSRGHKSIICRAVADSNAESLSRASSTDDSFIKTVKGRRSVASKAVLVVKEQPSEALSSEEPEPVKTVKGRRSIAARTVTDTWSESKEDESVKSKKGRRSLVVKTVTEDTVASRRRSMRVVQPTHSADTSSTSSVEKTLQSHVVSEAPSTASPTAASSKGRRRSVRNSVSVIKNPQPTTQKHSESENPETSDESIRSSPSNGKKRKSGAKKVASNSNDDSEKSPAPKTKTPPVKSKRRSRSVVPKTLLDVADDIKSHPVSCNSANERCEVKKTTSELKETVNEQSESLDEESQEDLRARLLAKMRADTESKASKEVLRQAQALNTPNDQRSPVASSHAEPTQVRKVSKQETKSLDGSKVKKTSDRKSGIGTQKTGSTQKLVNNRRSIDEFSARNYNISVNKKIRSQSMTMESSEEKDKTPKLNVTKRRVKKQSLSGVASQLENSALDASKQTGESDSSVSTTSWRHVSLRNIPNCGPKPSSSLVMTSLHYE